MKMVKSLLLGAAAGLVAMTGAQAADLPVKAKPVQYVKICSLYGAGFYYIPGTDTCIKVGGFIRAEINVEANGSFNPYHVENLDARAHNHYNMLARLAPSVDVRSQTEYGTLRGYSMVFLNHDTGGGVSAASPLLLRGFIQLAGFTAGVATSFFDFYNTPAYSNLTNVWSSDTGGGDFVFAYTAQFGNGLSATISAEDSNQRSTTLATAFVTPIAAAPSRRGYAGRQWMDLVGNVRVDQVWGSAQIMSALHEVRPSTSVGDDEFGYAFGAGVTFNLPMIGKGDTFSAQATYSMGAVRYAGSGVGSGFLITEGSTTGIGLVADAVSVGTSTELTEAWSIATGFQHVWNPKWKSSLHGVYGEVNFNSTAEAVVGRVDWSMYQVGSRTVFTPIPNLDLSVDIVYNHIDTGLAGTAAGVRSNPAAFGDVGWWQGIFRVQRNFYP